MSNKVYKCLIARVLQVIHENELSFKTVFQEFIQKTYSEVISGKDLYYMLKFASQKLEKNIGVLNNINVFPVPDGDTGINMHQTFQSITRELGTLRVKNHCGKIISAATKGAFLGSIGNSGIILAEYFRGLEQEWKNACTIDGNLFVRGLFAGARCAYQAVEKPREGTILTVARIIAETANEWIKELTNPFELLFIIFKEAKVALLDTHRILPEANVAGVVDAGAIGLVLMFEGFIEAIVDKFPSTPLSSYTIDDDLVPFLKPKIDFSISEQEFEVILKVSGLKKPIDIFKFELKKEGSCLLVITNDSLSEIKIHIHCTNPDRIISKISEFVSHIEVESIKSLYEQKNQLSKRLKVKDGV
ncbi:MAG: DAK2 domain-containing protein [Promethearchaeota archaeon]